MAKNYLFHDVCLGLIRPDKVLYEQNMNQANIALLPQWKALGNTGDLPVGWNGPPSAADQLKKQQEDTAALNAKQQAQQSDFLGRFRTAVAGQETLPDMASRIGGTLGLPALQQTAQGLTKSLAQLPDVQKNATRGFNVNANQLARIISSKQSELAPAAQQAVSQEQAAEGNLATQLGYGVAQQQKDLTPFTTEQSLMSDQLAREYSGFSQDKQNQLSLIMNQLQNQQAVSLQELQNANQLALAKIQYDNTKNDVSKYLTVGAGQTVINPANGQVIYSQPKAATPTSMGSWG